MDALSNDRYPYGAIERVNWLADVMKTPELQAASVAILAIDIARCANSKTGQAYPSLTRIAEEYCLTRQVISRAAGRLQEAEKIMALMRPGRTTIYQIILPVNESLQVEPVNENIRPCQQNFTGVVNTTTHEPLSETGTIPVLRKDSGGTETLPGAVSAANGKDIYPDFWRAFPLRSTVMESEEIITGLLAEGVRLQEIVDGALRYRKYSEETAGNRRQSAKQWLGRQSWRDDWTLPQKATSKKKENITRLRADFDLAVNRSDRKALTKLSERLENKYIIPHVWGGNKEPEDAYSDSAHELALCALCFGYLYEDRGEPCKHMADIIKLAGEVEKRLLGED